ncbi:MAG: 4'-phosphopantetheinyl transferase family protein [Roseibacillus sp.]
MTTPTLPACDEVHLWLLEHREIETARLNKEECARLESYRFERDRQRYAFTQNAKRIILANYLAQHPRDLVFEESNQGKPSLPGLEFNISHTEGLSVLGVSTAPSLGIDLEKNLPLEDLKELAKRVLTHTEQATLFELTADQLLTTFYRFWTAKEAYLKALGTGFEIEPCDVETDLPHFASISSSHRAIMQLTAIDCGQDFVCHLATESRPKNVSILRFNENAQSTS